MHALDATRKSSGQSYQVYFILVRGLFQYRVKALHNDLRLLIGMMCSIIERTKFDPLSSTKNPEPINTTFNTIITLVW
jgi:hypothetical protein